MDMRELAIDRGWKGWYGGPACLFSYDFVSYALGILMQRPSKSAPGYVTEKMLSAMYNGAIPIYWGGEEALRMFNRDAFVWWNPADPSGALELVQHLESNATAFREMQRRPMLADGALEKYFSMHLTFAGGGVGRKIRTLIDQRFADAFDVEPFG